MAQAACGQHFSWDCPLWCSGKKVKDKDNEVEPMCYRFPWYEGKNKERK